MSHRDRLGWALAAVVAAVALVATALVTTRTAAGVAADDDLRNWLLNTLPGPLRLGLDRFARPLVIVVLAPAVVALALLAVVRRGWRRAVVGLLVPAATVVAALELRSRDALGAGGDAFPSNHAAAGLGVLVGLAVVWPRPVTRRGLAVLAFVGFLIGLGNVTWYAHQPRDVVGSAFLVGAVAAAAFALVGGDSPNLARSGTTSGTTSGTRPADAPAQSS
jgi:membrane-associated phospholipid phosphatase